MKKIGLIGFGSFGQFMVGHLSPFFDILVYDQKDISSAVKKIGVTQVSLEEAAGQEIVILAIPVQFLFKLLSEIQGFIKPGAMILDVSSVKMKPVELMEKYLPQSVEILGTHPLFGPQSGANGIAGLRIVLCPVRIHDAKFNLIKSFLEESLKLKILIRTPQEHDKEMAYVQGLTHFVSKALDRLDISDFEQKTIAYQHLLDIRKMLKDDSLDLFMTMEKENPFAADVRKKFVEELNEIEKLIG